MRGSFDRTGQDFMATVHPEITKELAEFIHKQHLFFVATAPLSEAGHINLSPKGLDSFRIVSPLRVAYLDMTGSGNETASHLLENGRITFMFCAFEGYPNVLRLYGTGHAVLPDTPEWDELSPMFELHYGARQIIVADLNRVHTACGYAVPLMEYVSERDQLIRWAEAKGDDGLVAYRQEKNLCSVDGLPSPLAALKEE
jgi:hypothetical protein